MTTWRAVWLLVVRELADVARNGQVWGVSIIIPATILVQILGFAWVSSLVEGVVVDPVDVVVVDEVGIWEALEQEAARAPGIAMTRLTASERYHGDVLDDMVRDGVWDGWLFLPGDLLEGGTAEFHHRWEDAGWTPGTLSKVVDRAALRAAWGDEAPAWLATGASERSPGATATTTSYERLDVAGHSGVLLGMLVLYGLQAGFAARRRDRRGLEEILSCAVPPTARVLASSSSHATGAFGLFLTLVTLSVALGLHGAQVLFGVSVPLDWLFVLGVPGTVAFIATTVVMMAAQLALVGAFAEWRGTILSVVTGILAIVPTIASMGWALALHPVWPSPPDEAVWVPIAGIPGAWMLAWSEGRWDVLTGAVAWSVLATVVVVHGIARFGRALQVAGGFRELAARWRAAWRLA